MEWGGYLFTLYSTKPGNVFQLTKPDYYTALYWLRNLIFYQYCNVISKYNHFGLNL